VHKIVQRARLVDVLDKIRTRIATELAPLIDSQDNSEESMRSSGFASITVAGSNNQIVSNSPSTSAIQFNFSTGDLRGLLDALGDLGVTQESTGLSPNEWCRRS
jgi:hypothetical protein